MANMVKVTAVAATMFGAVLGSGSLWQYRQAENNQLNYKLAAATTSIQLRKELDELLQKIVVTTSGFDSLGLCTNPDGPLKKKAIELRARLDLYKDDFREIEKKLAVIEDRNVRDINLQFSPPCPPKNFAIQYSDEEAGSELVQPQ